MKRARIMAVTSGKGGVGKTFLSANLAAALAFEQRQAVAAHRFQRGAARQRRHLVPGRGQPGGKQAADGAQSYDAEFHLSPCR